MVYQGDSKKEKEHIEKNGKENEISTKWKNKCLFIFDWKFFYDNLTF